MRKIFLMALCVVTLLFATGAIALAENGPIWPTRF